MAKNRLIIKNEQKESDGGGVSQEIAGFTPTILDGTGGQGGASYNYTGLTASYVKTGRIVFFGINVSGLSFSGTPDNIFTIGNLPYDSEFYLTSDISVNIFKGSNLTESEVSKLKGVAFGNIITFILKDTDGINLQAVQFTSGRIWISGSYKTAL